MKTTPEGLTHLINMLVDAVNLQRKAQGTPTACCEVELTLDEEEHRVSVHLFAEVNVAASLEEPQWRSETLSADNNRTLTQADLDAAEMALVDSGYHDADATGDSVATAREAAQRVLAAVGLGLPDEPAAG